MYDFETILKRIKKVKAERQVTNEELATKSGVPLGTVNKILAGQTTEPKLPAFQSIAQALDVSTDFLIYGEEKTNPGKERFLTAYNQLNEEGQQKATEYCELLVSSGQYKKHCSAEMVDGSA